MSSYVRAPRSLHHDERATAEASWPINIGAYLGAKNSKAMTKNKGAKIPITKIIKVFSRGKN